MDQLSSLRVEHHERPLAVDVDRPRFGWRYDSVRRDLRQEAYRILVEGDEGTVWDTGWTNSSVQQHIEYGGAPLQAGAAYVWKLDVRLDDGTALDAVSGFETAPPAEVWGRARWITIPRATALHEDRRPLPHLRRRITVREPVRRARLYATAGGIFQPWLDGRPLSESHFAPGWTDYRYRVPFHVTDVTEAFDAGEHVLGAVLADGWYSGFLGPFNRRDFWGDTPVFRALLRLDLADGRTEWVGTDSEWEGAFGSVQAADLLHGAVVDTRQELAGWSTGAAVGRWVAAIEHDGPAGRLVPARIEPIAPVAELEPVEIREHLPGTWIVDFGQNLAGRVRLTVDGPAGAIVRIRHAELLDGDGGLYLDNLRGARATDTVILDGAGPVAFEPPFTFHGFRYAEITGLARAPESHEVRAIALSSVPRIAGRFDTGNALVDRLYRNIEWAMRSNFLEVPMDCPQRDERLGWGGDAQAFSATSMLLADVNTFQAKWVDDLFDAQKPNGAFADIAPCVVLEFAEEGAAGYADAGVFVPWNHFRAYGDERILAVAIDGAIAWIEHIRRANPDLVWREQRQADYGDWLAPIETDKALVATAYFARAVQVTGWMAEVLGRESDVARLTELHAGIASAYRAAFLAPDGSAVDGTQTAQVLGLEFGLLEDWQRTIAETALAADVEGRGHLTTGFLAVEHVLPQLTRLGRNDLAHRMLLREETPSWGYQVRRGLTTTGEHWDAWMPDGELRDPWMNSFNHFALGAVARWLHEDVGGIRPAAPGYERIRIEPTPDVALPAVATRIASPRGDIESRWRLTSGGFELEVVVPPNTDAVVVLPGTGAREAGRPAGDAEGVRSIAESDARTTIEVGSGRYRFSTDLSPQSLSSESSAAAQPVPHSEGASA